MRFNSRKLCRFLFMFFTGSTSFSVLLHFLLSITRKSSSLLLIFDAISSNIDEVLTISPYIDVFVFGDFNFHNKDWVTVSGGTDKPGELCYNFCISNDLTQMVNFPTQIRGCDSLSLPLLDLFLSSNISICSAMTFPQLGNSDCFCLSFHWLSVKLKMGCPVSSHSLWQFLCSLRQSSKSFERCPMEGYL